MTRFHLGMMLCFVVAGCATGGDRRSPVPSLEIAEQQGSPREVVVWTSHPIRPDWLLTEPAPQEGLLFFVGVSVSSTTEQDARDDAYAHALKRVIQYFGSEVVSVAQKATVSYGLGSEVVDPTIAMKEFERQMSAAIARQVKAADWYFERVNRTEAGVTTAFYLAWLRASVPETEVKRAIEEQEQRAKQVAEFGRPISEELSAADQQISRAERVMSANAVQSYSFAASAADSAEKARAAAETIAELAPLKARAEAILGRAKRLIDTLLSDPDMRLQAAVKSLAQGLTSAPLCVAVCRVTYASGETGRGSVDTWVTKRLQEELVKPPSPYRVIPRDTLQEAMKRTKTSLADVARGIFPPGWEESARPQALLYVSYQESTQGGQFRLELELREVGSGVLTSSTSTLYPMDRLPEKHELKPQNWGILEAAKPVFNEEQEGKLKIRVWPDKGEGASYRDGEEVVFHFTVNQDAFVYLYHMDSAGSMTLLFPNRFESNNFATSNVMQSIPTPNMRFTLKVTPPFGTEMVKAVASLTKFPTGGTAGVDGFETFGNIRSEATRGIITRSIQAAPKFARAESFCAITTVGR